eukprot:jgi/Orpsp1_1/1177226/evm.model.c7180000060614.1
MYVFLYFQYINSLNITINSEYIPFEFIYKYGVDNYMLETELKNKGISNFDNNYYCKNSYCVEVEGYSDIYFVEFPENNEFKRYIINYCIYDDKYNKVIDCNNHKIFKLENETVYLDLTCTKDSECFYDKCIDGYCVFNENSLSTHCNYVHKEFTIFQSTSFHCGKTYNDACKFDFECSSDSCSGFKCDYNHYVPSDHTFTRFLETILFFTIIISIFIICCCFYNYKSNHKNKQQFNKLENSTK